MNHVTANGIDAGQFVALNNIDGNKGGLPSRR
jgi:hypothetical protein